MIPSVRPIRTTGHHTKNTGGDVGEKLRNIVKPRSKEKRQGSYISIG